MSPFRSASGHADTADHRYHGQHLATRRPGPQVIPSTLILILSFSHSHSSILSFSPSHIPLYTYFSVPIHSFFHSHALTHSFPKFSPLLQSNSIIFLYFIPSFPHHHDSRSHSLILSECYHMVLCLLGVGWGS